MKKYFLIGILALLLLVFVSACKDEIKSLGEPFSKLEGINASWVLTEVRQVDKVNILSPDTLLDVTDVLVKGTPSEITFDSENRTFTFNPGDVPNYLGPTSGNWKFDDDNFPSKVILNDTLDLRMLRTVRPIDNTLELQVARFCGGELTTAYNYIFTRK